ncbi:hypothetical protein JCM33774_33120 [Actinophytocola sp. KF-1]
MTDSPVTVTPIFDQLVAEFGRRDRTVPERPQQAPAAGPGTPADETAAEAHPGTAV